MNDTLKQILLRFILPILVPVIVGLGSAVISSVIMNEKLEARVTNLEKSVDDEKLLGSVVN